MTTTTRANAPRTRLLEAIVRWAAARDDLRAVQLVGSLARGTGASDTLSDVDLVLWSSALPDCHTLTADDFSSIGQVWLCLPDAWMDGGIEYYLLVDDGLKADLAFGAVDTLRALAAQGRLYDFMQRGTRTLLDKDGLLAALPPTPVTLPLPPAPDARQFRDCCERFWLSVFAQAKTIARGDLWSVKHRDRAVKDALLQVLQWHAALRGADSWYSGRHMPQWTDAGTWAQVQQVYAHFDAADSARALWAGVALFRRLANAIAGHYGLTTYPADVDRLVSGWAARMLAEVGTAPPE